MNDLFTFYLGMMTFVTFLLFGGDKRYAIRHEWRIPERILFMMALIGGAAGAWLGMYIFKHKTQHLSFYIGIPLILFCHLGIYLYLIHFPCP